MLRTDERVDGSVDGQKGREEGYFRPRSGVRGRVGIAGGYVCMYGARPTINT